LIAAIKVRPFPEKVAFHDPMTAHGTALTILNGEVQIQTPVMAYSNSFYVVRLILLCSCDALIFISVSAKAQGVPSAG
jgi:hypothetical protein